MAPVTTVGVFVESVFVEAAVWYDARSEGARRLQSSPLDCAAVPIDMSEAWTAALYPTLAEKGA
jgi:hypothetical protein